MGLGGRGWTEALRRKPRGFAKTLQPRPPHHQPPNLVLKKQQWYESNLPAQGLNPAAVRADSFFPERALMGEEFSQNLTALVLQDAADHGGPVI